MEGKKQILIVEDDADICMIEEAYLHSAGYETAVLQDGMKVADYVRMHHSDLVLLDVMLPGKSGYEICREIRDVTDAPILMVTARTEPVDRIRGLGFGADDYIPKPFDPAELVARVNAHLRQVERLSKDAGKSEEDSDIIRIGDVEIQISSRRVFKAGKEIPMPNKEFELLKFLAQNPDIVFSKDQLMDKIWGYDYAGDGATVMVHINRLREKIEDESRSPKILETVRGAGYRLNMMQGSKGHNPRRACT